MKSWSPRCWKVLGTDKYSLVSFQRLQAKTFFGAEFENEVWCDGKISESWSERASCWLISFFSPPVCMKLTLASRDENAATTSSQSSVTLQTVNLWSLNDKVWLLRTASLAALRPQRLQEIKAWRATFSFSGSLDELDPCSTATFPQNQCYITLKQTVLCLY